MFVRLFFAGGARDEELMLASSAPMNDGAAPEGPAIGGADAYAPPEVRFLFRAPGDKVSGWTKVSAVVG